MLCYGLHVSEHELHWKIWVSCLCLCLCLQDIMYCFYFHNSAYLTLPLSLPTIHDRSVKSFRASWMRGSSYITPNIYMHSWWQLYIKFCRVWTKDFVWHKIMLKSFQEMRHVKLIRKIPSSHYFYHFEYVFTYHSTI